MLHGRQRQRQRQQPKKAKNVRPKGDRKGEFLSVTSERQQKDAWSTRGGWMHPPAFMEP